MEATSSPSSLVASSTGLLPGLVAAALCGAMAMSQGAVVGASVAGLLAVPFGLASAGAASARGRGAGASALCVPGVAALVAGPALAIFGGMLKANTHHKALAGVTFAVVAAGVVVGGVVAGARVAQVTRRYPAVGYAAGALGLAVVAGLVARGGGLRGLDMLLGVAAAAVGWALAPRPSRALGAGALGVTAAAAVLGVLLGRAPGVAAQVQPRSLIASGVLLPLVAPAGGDAVTPELAQPPAGH